MQSALPAALTARVDWSTLALEPGSFVDETLRDRHTDLLFSASLSGRKALLYLLYLLYEHQSNPHRLMPFRLLVYVVRILEGWLNENPTATHLPAVLPVVIHHGEGGWTAARALEDLYDLDAEALAAAGEHLVRLRFVLDDLDAETDDALRARAMSALGRLCFYCFRHARDPDELVRGLGGWVETGGHSPAARRGDTGTGQAGGDDDGRRGAHGAWRASGAASGTPRAAAQAAHRALRPVARVGNGEARRVEADQLDAWGERLLTAVSLDEVLG